MYFNIQDTVERVKPTRLFHILFNIYIYFSDSRHLSNLLISISSSQTFHRKKFHSDSRVQTLFFLKVLYRTFKEDSKLFWYLAFSCHNIQYIFILVSFHITEVVVIYQPIGAFNLCHLCVVCLILTNSSFRSEVKPQSFTFSCTFVCQCRELITDQSENDQVSNKTFF